MNWWHSIGFIIVMGFVLWLIPPFLARWVNEPSPVRVPRATRVKPAAPTLDDFFAGDDDDEARRRILGS